MADAVHRVVVHDATLRDGQHAVAHQLDTTQLRAYAQAADRAGIAVVEVGHGNGLGASSIHIGRSRLSDDAMLSTVRAALTNSRLGVFIAPGWGRGDDIRRAVDLGADVVRVGAHCTEADVSERHVGLARALGVEAQVVLLMSHMLDGAGLAAQCLRAVGFGAHAVGVMDSAGHYLPDDVDERIRAIAAAAGDTPVIFHGHNNLAMAMANSVTAVRAGAGIIDACARGFGAGAGNTQLEVLAAVLDRLGYRTGIDLRAVLSAADLAEQQLMPAPPTIDSISLVSGLAGVFSGFKAPVIAAAAQAGVDPLEVFTELGRRQAVAGQEDLIAHVITSLTDSSRPPR